MSSFLRRAIAFQEEARSKLPVLGYTVPCALGNILRTAWGPVIVLRTKSEAPMPLWSWLVPVLSMVLLLATLAFGAGPWLVAVCAAALVGAVIVAVHHAEVVAHRVGEPLGTLVLALAVTAIETALIVSMMIAGGEDSAVLPRDAICRRHDHL